MLKRKIWEEWEDEYILKYYPVSTSLEIARQLGRSLSSVYSRAGILGVKKSEQFLKDPTLNPQLAKFLEGGRKTRFKKGDSAFNKGLKQKEFMSKDSINRTKATRFKKGDRPANWKPVGSTRINVDGYVEVKVKEPRTWKLQHRVLWEEHHGKIPKAHAVIFKNNNSLDIRIDNLELITLAENMARNSIQTYPEEVKEAMRKQSKLENIIYGKKDKQIMDKQRKRIFIKERVEQARKRLSQDTEQIG
jgi:hypothetical protein